ncbi:MAG: hypothetical protein ACYSU2_05100 [Planctomycetota bacterium]
MKDLLQAYARTLRSLLAGIDPDAPCRPSVDPHQHVWVVFTTYLEPVWLGVMCLRCGSDGAVQNPSRKEWRRAHSAPTKPYHFTEPARVKLITNRIHVWEEELRELS